MRRSVKLFVVGLVAVLGYGMLQGVSLSNVQDKQGTLLAHDVYFTLKDNSPAAKKTTRGPALTTWLRGRLARRSGTATARGASKAA